MEYEVQHKAIIWYKVMVEANSAVEAIQKVREGELTQEENDSYWQVPDSEDFLDDYWTEETGLYDGPTGTYENEGELDA